MGQELYVWDTELTTRCGRCYLHGKTKEKPRYVDGYKHPVTVIKPKAEVRNGRG